MPALLHAGSSIYHWNLAPSILAGAAVVAVLYVFALTSLWPAGSHSRGQEWRRAAFFFAGWGLILLALISPLDAVSHRLLSFHMLQHIVISTLAPPLVLLGLPAEVLRRFLRPGRLLGFVRLLFNPFPAAAVFIINMWFWHAPPMYGAAMDHLWVHIVMHIAFIGTGLVFWWPAVEPLPEASSMGNGGRLLYVVVSGFPMGILALLLLSSSGTIYSFYASVQPLWGLSTVVDQQIAGMIMGSLGEAATFIGFTVLFFRVMSGDEAAPESAAH